MGSSGVNDVPARRIPVLIFAFITPVQGHCIGLLVLTSAVLHRILTLFGFFNCPTRPNVYQVD